jgi:hypothetical protein
MARMRSRNRRGVLGLRNVKWRLLARLQMVEPPEGVRRDSGTWGAQSLLRSPISSHSYRDARETLLCRCAPRRPLLRPVCYARNGGERRGSTCGLLAAELLFREQR